MDIKDETVDKVIEEAMEYLTTDDNGFLFSVFNNKEVILWQQKKIEKLEKEDRQM